MPICHINADDFGLHADIDRGIVACVDRARVTGISLSPNGSSVDWTLAKELSTRVAVGVHVTLVGEPWITQPRTFAKWTTLMPWLALPGRRLILEREIEAQVTRMIERGVRPRHLDSHQHVHVMPPIWSICERLAERFGIPRIRTPATPTRALAKPSPAGQVLQRLAERRRGARGGLACIGIAHAGHNAEPILMEELRRSQPMDVELVAHPAIDTAALRERYRDWRFDWELERGALLGDGFGAACAELGYEIRAP